MIYFIGNIWKCCANKINRRYGGCFIKKKEEDMGDEIQFLFISLRINNHHNCFLRVRHTERQYTSVCVCVCVFMCWFFGKLMQGSAKSLKKNNKHYVLIFKPFLKNVSYGWLKDIIFLYIYIVTKTIVTSWNNGSRPKKKMWVKNEVTFLFLLFYFFYKKWNRLQIN